MAGSAGGVSSLVRGLIFVCPRCDVDNLTSRSQAVEANGFTGGYTPLIWVMILLSGGGGLVIAAVMKYADNILKGFAASLSVVLSAIVSFFSPAFDFEPTVSFVFGSVLVLTAACESICISAPHVSTPASVPALPTTCNHPVCHPAADADAPPLPCARLYRPFVLPRRWTQVFFPLFFSAVFLTQDQYGQSPVVDPKEAAKDAQPPGADNLEAADDASPAASRAEEGLMSNVAPRDSALGRSRQAAAPGAAAATLGAST